jgi:hypothetical protein
MELCPLCGQVSFLDVDDLIYELREFTLTSCCDANLSGWLEDMATWTRRQWVGWFERHTALRVRQILVDDGLLSWRLDYGLELHTIPWPEARAFVLEHHRHNQTPQGWKFRSGAL